MSVVPMEIKDTKCKCCGRFLDFDIKARKCIQCKYEGARAKLKETKSDKTKPKKVNKRHS